MFKKIQIHRFIFTLKPFKDDSTKTVQSTFIVQGKLPAQMDEDDMRDGAIFQQEIFDGKWDWLIQKPDIITLPVYNILITLVGPIYNGSVRYRRGEIHSSIKEICPHCRDLECYFDCSKSSKWQNIKDAMTSIEKRAELENHRNYNYACDAIEAMVLAHAVAGVNVETAAYLEGIETAIDAASNNI